MSESEGAPKQFSSLKECVIRDSPKLVALLKEMKNGLDIVTGKVQAVLEKVKQHQYRTGDGISYLDAKHLLLLSYCQSIVYYLLRKAEGLPISGHPVVRSLVEFRLFLEKIRPIDKKLEYQVQKLTRIASNVTTDKAEVDQKNKDVKDAEDPLKYRPNPDMLVSKSDQAMQDGGIYRPPRFAPVAMDEDKMSKQEKQAIRREREDLRHARQSAYLKELMDEVEGRPEEIRETVGAESRELSRYKAQLEDRARQEEELFIRAPITKQEKKKEKHLLKSRDGLLGLADDFFDDIRTLPFDDKGNGDVPTYKSSRGEKKFNKRKRKN